MHDEIDAITESAKAAQEVAKTANNVTNKAASVGQYLYAIVGEPVDLAVSIYITVPLRERLFEAKIYSTERIIALRRKVDERLKARGSPNIRIVPLKIALPLIEHASLEDEDDLHSLYANLLTAGLDASAAQIHRKYVTTLVELTGEDAKVLKTIYNDWESTGKNSEFECYGIKYGPFVDGMRSHSAVSVVTLNRLGLIAPYFVDFRTYLPPGHDGDWKTTEWSEEVRALGGLENVVMTEFGCAFCKAVIAA